jgi:hypothetical protein
VPLLADSDPFLWLPKEDRMPAERTTMRQVSEAIARGLTARTVEIFAKGERIAAYMRSSGNYKHSESANTCHPVIGAMPTGPSIVSARKRPTPGRQLPHCANSSWSTGPMPNRASAPAAASCALSARSAVNASKPLPHVPVSTCIVSNGKVPRPVKLIGSPNGRNAWDEETIDRWCEDRKAEARRN